MDLLTTYLDRVQRLYPSLRVQRATLVTDGGQYHHLLFATTPDGEIVFRFPRFEGVAQLDRTVRLLRALHGRVPLPTPDPRYVSLTAEVGHAFIGYPLIPGRPLEHDTVASLSAPALERIVAQAIAFLRALHAIPLADAYPAGALSPTTLVDEWRALYARIRRHLFPSMRPSARDDVTRQFEDFLADPHLAAIRPVVVHGDFGTGNLLFDPATQRLTGVVDFQHTSPSRPALDYAPLTGDFPLRLIRRLVPEIDAMARRISFYRGTYLLQEALYGAEHDDPEALEGGLAPYTLAIVWRYVECFPHAARHSGAHRRRAARVIGRALPGAQPPACRAHQGGVPPLHRRRACPTPG